MSITADFQEDDGSSASRFRMALPRRRIVTNEMPSRCMISDSSAYVVNFESKYSHWGGVSGQLVPEVDKL